ncbi:glycoside hydrolase family 43 protein [Dyella tabacisoli]|uniref:Glycoside hydrolase family 43 protein n=1 Tax=Dyella tabacisoli TaxID=2282381 RepID=A0A369UIM3_9GAMM|nr:glycoside hydrolase family 43 protein [Dyella tabacisoli]RDD80396.1 glycoside hydrolase family 43 protein [Dyella tabacisoli]
MKRLLLGVIGWLVFSIAHTSVVVKELSYRGDDDGPALSRTQYRNPVLAGFYPDPSAIRVGDDFYLVNSSFGYFPGLPVFHSRDLVTWMQIGNAIDRPSQIDYGRNELTRGLFAASISHHDGTFYITNTCFYCDGGNYVITAKNPAGPWSNPVWLKFEGIDPSLFFDEDGTAWLVNNGVPEGKLRYEGHRAIWIQQFDVASMKLIGPRKVIVDAGANPAKNPEHVEGPHLFRNRDYYYLMAAEGGTGEQHAQMIYRSRTITGPYETWVGNPVLTQRDLPADRPHPVTSAGHAQFVELKDGSWWAVFLATRPYRGNHYNLGRETFLLPATWQDGWPVVLPHGEPVPLVAKRPALPHEPMTAPMNGPFHWSEHFQASALPMQWMTINAPHKPWYVTGADGLHIEPSMTPLGDYKSGQPAYIAHRLQHHRARISATFDLRKMDPAEQAGLALLQNETHFYAAGLTNDISGRSVVLYMRSSKDTPATGAALARIALPGDTTSISIRFELDGPRLDVFYALKADDWHPLRQGLDASLLSTASAGGFTGVTFGPYAYKPATDSGMAGPAD